VRLTTRIDNDSGSAALECVLLLSLVGLLVLALTGANVPSRTGEALAQALCRMFPGPGGAGDCRSQPAPTGAPTSPCILSSTGADAAVELDVSFVDLGGGAGFTVEELSDGTYRVLWADEALLGATAALAEGQASVRVGDRRAGLGGRAAADIALRHSEVDGRIFPDQDAALRYVLQRALDEGAERLPAGPREVVQAVRGFFDQITGNERDHGELQREVGETGLRIGGEATSGLGPLGGGLVAAGEGAVRTTQFADGSRSVALLLSTQGSAGLGVPLVTELEGLAGGEFEARFTVDANGELSRLRIGVVTEGGFGLTRGRENVNAALREGRRGAQRLSQSDRTVFGYELELDDPALRDAASRFLQQAPRAGADLAVGDRAALRAAAADLWSGAEPFSTITVREHSDDDAGAGFAGKLGLLGVLRGGASGDATLNSTELVAAHYWDTTNGGWVRDDTACLGP